jgi:hypothetical protein
MQGGCICLSTNHIFEFLSSHQTLLQLNIALSRLLMLLYSESLCILSYAKFDTYDLFISKLVTLVLLICLISICIYSYYIFITHTHSEVVADEVMAETLQLVHVHPDPLFLENITIAQSVSRIAPNYHPPIGPICTY